MKDLLHVAARNDWKPLKERNEIIEPLMLVFDVVPVVGTKRYTVNCSSKRNEKFIIFYA